MSGVVVRFERRVASLAVITKLVELGYLQAGARHRATAVERAIDRLRTDLVRQGVVYDSNLPSSPKDEDRQGSTQIGERVLSLPKRRLPTPWTVDETDACFIVKDHAGLSLALC